MFNILFFFFFNTTAPTANVENRKFGGVHNANGHVQLKKSISRPLIKILNYFRFSSFGGLLGGKGCPKEFQFFKRIFDVFSLSFLTVKNVERKINKKK